MLRTQIGLERTLPEFIAGLRETFGEVRRVLRNDGLFWLNISDGYTSGNRGWHELHRFNRLSDLIDPASQFYRDFRDRVQALTGT